jgi:hypothetical protein
MYHTFLFMYLDMIMTTIQIFVTAIILYVFGYGHCIMFNANKIDLTW